MNNITVNQAKIFSLRSMLSTARKSRNMWRERYKEARNKFVAMHTKNRELRQEINKLKEIRRRELMAESKLAGWKVFEERYGGRSE